MKYVITTKYLPLNEKLMCMSHGLINGERICHILMDDRINLYAFANEADYNEALKTISKNAIKPF